MALTKRTYVDGETIITAQNLNDIQDEVIAHESNKVPITRTVNSKALSSNITLSASDVGAVPTTRTVNSKALSSNITLSASDVGAVPTTRTVNSKALSSNITLTAGDIGYSSSTTYSASTVGKAIVDLTGSVNSADSAIAIFANNNTHAAVASGQYVYVKNHSALSEGLYLATASIPQDGTLSTSNVTAVSGGGLNQVAAIARGGTGASSADSAKVNLGIGHLNSNTLSVSANATTSITVPNNTRALLIGFGSAGFLASVSVTSSGGVSYQDYFKASTISFTTGTNKLNIANSSTANVTCGWIDFLNHELSV